jgi:CRP/FNR family transcriptional regulator, nitrogen fixation regulation protein
MYSTTVFQAAPACSPGTMVPTRNVRTFARHQQVFGQGDPVRGFYQVLSGAVRTSKLFADGRRQIDAFHVAGELFGFERGQQHRSIAEVIRAARIVTYDQSYLDDGLEFAQQVLAIAMERSQDHAVLLGRCTAVEKIATFLVDLADRLRSDVIELSMDRYDIADYVGLTMETVSRTLWQLDRSSLISIAKSRKIWLRDRAKLEELVPWETRTQCLRCEPSQVVPFARSA